MVLSVPFSRVTFWALLRTISYWHHRVGCNKHHDEVGGWGRWPKSYLSIFVVVLPPTHHTLYRFWQSMPRACLHPYPPASHPQKCERWGSLSSVLSPYPVLIPTVWLTNSASLAPNPAGPQVPSLLTHLPLSFFPWENSQKHKCS